MSPVVPHWTLPKPDLTLDSQGTPRDDRHGDIYFQPGEGWAEGHHVFLEGTGFPDDWRHRHRITVCELGFGTGLNLLLTWDALRRLPRPRPALRYLAVEGFPLDRTELAPILASTDAPADLVAGLLDRLPPRQPGLHHISLEEGVDLILAQGPVEPMLASLSGLSADIWYLDGFAPSTNPDMWTPQVLAWVAALSAPGARLATFTAAGAVKRGLADLGFSVQRRPGYGRKHHCLSARLEAPPLRPTKHARPAQPRPALPKGALLRKDSGSKALWPGRPLAQGARVALIGAGIAGCAAAHALSRAGLTPLLLEARDSLAAEASGNPLGIFMPRLAVEPSAEGRFHAAAWVHALRVYQDLADRGADPWVGPAGLLSLPVNDRDEARQRKVAAAFDWPEEWLTLPDAAEQARRTGQPGFHNTAALWMGAARCIRPGVICQALAGSTPRRLGFSVVDMTREKGLWRLLAADGREERAEAVILCAGAQAGTLQPSGTPPPQITRGQISLFDTPEPMPAHPMSFGGYISPPITGPDGAPLQILGASHEPMTTPEDPGWDQPDPASHAHCLNMLIDHLPELATRLADKPWRVRISRRARTPDRTPLVGPLLASEDQAVSILGDLRHGPRRRPPEDRIPEAYTPDLWVLGALGSRGFQTATLASEILAASLTGKVLPVEEDVRQALHPARFLIRALARGTIGT
ncbi:FAD-dependent 5-carboxymethylaminomethyl-2-thiouridine(34) oxidoreductase MnmC [Rhodospirillum sp. A1_3_36]|uniref:FAD-dependent 5-carboxymethylaminomethyl-2-thiouridine(34) oxidoreductase MnmC n=1 Tax=Rhodospirillum sp. A1_3_36 TaxID=3391666 RepID=UPI0039A73293